MKRILSLVLLFAACRNAENTGTPKNDTVIISHDTIPETRANVSGRPVASFRIPVKDELNDWQFAVEVYETKKRFGFTLRMQYKELRVSDSLKIPNFGIEPKIELRKGPEPYSCIIGFLDKQGTFKEYKKAYVKNEQLKLTTLNYYYTASYKTPKR